MPLLVQHLAHIVRVHAVEHERHRRRPVLDLTPVGGPARLSARRRSRPTRARPYTVELVLVRGDPVHADRRQVVHGRTQPDRLRVIGTPASNCCGGAAKVDLSMCTISII